MENLGVYLNNITNDLVTKEVNYVPIIRKFGHPWFFLARKEAMISYLTQSELFRLHSRFGHSSVRCLYKLLYRSGYDVDQDALEMITKFCHHCQVKSSAYRRFKFLQKDDQEFNYEIIVTVMYLAGKPLLNVVDWVTTY